MNNQEIESRVIEVLAKKLSAEPATIQAETRLAEDLGVDSFGAVELIFEIEEAFGLKITDSEIEHVRKVSDIVAYVAKHLGNPPQASDTLAV